MRIPQTLPQALDQLLTDFPDLVAKWQLTHCSLLAMAPALHRAEGRRYESPSGASVAEFLMVQRTAVRLRLAHAFHQLLQLFSWSLEKVLFVVAPGWFSWLGDVEEVLYWRSTHSRVLVCVLFLYHCRPRLSLVLVKRRPSDRWLITSSV